MLVSEEARVFQVRGLRCSKEPTVLGLSPVRLGNRTYRAWMTTKLTPMVRFCGVLAQILPIRGKICLCFTFAICIPNRTGHLYNITELFFESSFSLWCILQKLTVCATSGNLLSNSR